MGTRAPAASLALGLALLLAGTAFGVGATPGRAALAPVAPRSEELTVTADVTAAQTEPAAALAAAASVARAESLPTPKDAPATAVFDDMKHVWQSLNNC